MSKKYVRLTKTVYDKGVLIPQEDIQNHIKEDKDYYISTYYYNENHFQKFPETESIKGIKDVKTDKIWFDFDSKEDIELARKDTLELLSRFQQNNIDPNKVEIYFSGNKGFNVILKLDREVTRKQVENIALRKFGNNLDTLDHSLYDESQILRVPKTRHQKSGLFKIPLTFNQIKKFTSDQIKALAKEAKNPYVNESKWSNITLNEDFFEIEDVKKELKTTATEEFDVSKRPKGWKASKWALVQGYFKSGERNISCLILAATCKGMGYDKLSAYYLCKGALKRSHERFGEGDFTKEELWQIVERVFGDEWQGGQFTVDSEPVLKKICDRLGIKEDKTGSSLKKVEDLEKTFANYAVNFEKNIVKTGIPTLDENVMFLCSTHNGILGQPGSGKTSFALQWLKQCSSNNIGAVFYSLDMGEPIIYAKLIQAELGINFREALKKYRDNPKIAEQLNLKEKYKNVLISFKSGITTEHIKEDIKQHEEITGQKVRLLIVDYLECLAGPYSDPLANTAFISQQMKDLANELSLCSIMLLQTQKHSTSDVSDPLLSMKQVKGSSVIEQASSVILTLWREGYNPKTVEDDDFISFAAVKNRFGSLWTYDFHWDGVKGLTSEMTEEGHEYLKDLKKRKKDMKAEKSQEDDWK